MGLYFHIEKGFQLKLIELLTNGIDKDEPCITLYMNIEKARSAYKMTCSGLAYYVMKAVLGLPCLVDLNTFTHNLKDVLFFFEDLLKMYMKSNEARMMCLNAVKDCCLDSPHMNQGEAAAYLIYSLHLQEVVTLHSVLEFLRELEETENPLMDQNSLQMLHGWLKQEAERAVSLPKKGDEGEEEEDRPICYWLDELPTTVLPRRYVWVRCEGASPFTPMFLWNAMDAYYQYMQQIIDGDGSHEHDQYEGEEQDEEEEIPQQGRERPAEEPIPQGRGGEPDEEVEIPQAQGGERPAEEPIPQGRGRKQDEEVKIPEAQGGEEPVQEPIPQGQGGEQNEKEEIPQAQRGEPPVEEPIPQAQGREQPVEEPVHQRQGEEQDEKEKISQAQEGEQSVQELIPQGQEKEQDKKVKNDKEVGVTQKKEQDQKEKIPRESTQYEGEENIPQEGKQCEVEKKHEVEIRQKGEQYRGEEQCDRRNEKVNNMIEKNKMKKRKYPKVNKIRQKNN